MNTMINNFKKYKILILIYLLGIIASLITAYIINSNNILSKNLGKSSVINFSYNEEIFKKINLFYYNLEIYYNLRDSNSIKFIKFPKLPKGKREFIHILNNEKSSFQKALSLYISKNFEDVALSKTSRSLYGQLNINDQNLDETIFFIIRVDSNQDEEEYKKILTKSNSEIILNEIKEFQNNILNQKIILEKEITELNKKINGSDFEYIKNTDALNNLNLDKYSTIVILSLIDNFIFSLSDIEIIKDIEVNFYKDQFLSNSVFFITPLIFVIIISFFVLLLRIFYDYKKK